MIKINLLPLDKRRAERTPFPRLMLIVGTAAAACAVGAILFWIYLQIKSVEEEKVNWENQKKNLRASVKEHGRLKKATNALLAKIRQIDKVAGRKIEIWRTVDSVWEIVSDNSKIWLDEIRLLDSKEVSSIWRRIEPRSRTYPLYGLALDCHAAGVNAKDITRFRMALKDHPYLKVKFDLMNYDPHWTIEEDTEFAVPYSMSFRLVMLPRPKIATPPPRAAAKPAAKAK